ncbi:MAG: 5-(carboxyamino)imidazole ribonucleotide mutase, partial [Aequorivita sp.]|nr:5-(carboxyamino)imidazole ribonucleotide mutase [Aequorivita sp.]
GILAAQIIGSSDKAVLDRIIAYKESLKTKVEEGAKKMKGSN